MTALRMVATATAQVLRLVADVIDPEPAYGYPRQARADVDAADATWTPSDGSIDFGRYVIDGREIARAVRGAGHG